MVEVAVAVVVLPKVQAGTSRDRTG
jgi:hypothetical protein